MFRPVVKVCLFHTTSADALARQLPALEEVLLQAETSDPRSQTSSTDAGTMVQCIGLFLGIGCSDREGVQNARNSRQVVSGWGAQDQR